MTTDGIFINLILAYEEISKNNEYANITFQHISKFIKILWFITSIIINTHDSKSSKSKYSNWKMLDRVLVCIKMNPEPNKRGKMR